MGYPVACWYEAGFWERCIHPDDRDYAIATCAEHSKTLDDYEFEYRMLAADGSVVWLHDIVHVLRAGREPRALQGFMIDITQRKDAERRLRAAREELEARFAERTRELQLSEARLKEAQEIAKVGNWERDLVTNELWLSDEAYRLLGLDAEAGSVSEDVVASRIHPEDRSRVRAALAEVRANGRPCSIEHRVILPNGDVRHVQVQVVMEREGGAPVRLAGTFQDVTEQVRLQRDVIAAGEYERRRVGHDLHDGVGQELTGISLSLQALSGALAQEGSSQQEAAREIRKRTQKAIGDVRRLSRLLSPGVAEHDGLRGALQRLVREVGGYPGVSCTLEGAGACDVIRDPEVATHLYRIAQESINNALRHGRAKAIVVRLSCAADLLRLEIIDDGRGMPAEQDRLEGMGLRGMRYRARVINGSLEITRRRSARGTCVRCTCPVTP